MIIRRVIIGIFQQQQHHQHQELEMISSFISLSRELSAEMWGKQENPLNAHFCRLDLSSPPFVLSF